MMIKRATGRIENFSHKEEEVHQQKAETVTAVVEAEEEQNVTETIEAKEAFELPVILAETEE